MILFLILVALWGAFFSSFKYFLWWVLADWLAPNLQTISWYISFGWIFAYLIGWAFASVFLKKYYLFVISLLSFVFVLCSYIFVINTSINLAIILTSIGFLYGLWTVVKNVLVAIEIQKTGLSDTIINAIAEIVFIIFLIWGTIGWNILFEQMWQQGFTIILWGLAATAWISLMLDYESQSFASLISNSWRKYFWDRKKQLLISFQSYVPQLTFITKKYGVVMLTSSILWAISTVASQTSVEVSVANFGMNASSAASLLLFSAVWAIVWNIISMKMDTKRWVFWIIFSSLFSLSICFYVFFTSSFIMMWVLASLLGLFFWASSNLIDGYFINQMGIEDTKEYGASSYWLILSVIIFVLMFVSSAITKTLWNEVLMPILGILMFVMSFISYKHYKKI